MIVIPKSRAGVTERFRTDSVKTAGKIVLVNEGLETAAVQDEAKNERRLKSASKSISTEP